MKLLKYLWRVTRKAGVRFDTDNCYRFSAALSFYTLFSIAPIILISIYVAGLFARDVDFQELMTSQFSRLVGHSGAEGIGVLLDSLQYQDRSKFQLIIGIFVLLFSATNIFIQLQGSFNEIFKVKPKENAGIKKIFRDRLTSLGLILSLGFIMLISLVLDSMVMGFRNWLEAAHSDIAVDLITVGETLILASLTFSVIFALYRFLPDVKIPRRYLLWSALVATTLMLLGKFGINWYISSSHFNDLGGASASIIILMLWVYYSSYILFFGAELIGAMAAIAGYEFRTSHYAARVKTVRIESDE